MEVLTGYIGELREPLLWDQGSQVSMRVARGSTSLLSTHGGESTLLEIRKGEGAQMKWCREPQCSSGLRPVSRRTFWVALRVPSTFSTCKTERGTSLDAVRERASSCDDGVTTWFFLQLWRDSRVTMGNSGCLLCWPWEVQSSIRVARESWGLLSSHCRANRPHLGLCPEANVPLQGRQGSRGCIPDSPGESGLVLSGSKELRSPLELRRVSLGAH